MSHRILTGKVVVATHNAGKLVEMRELLAPFGVEAVSAGELGLAEPDETGTMFSENAAIKAIAASILRRFRLELAEPDRRVSIRQMPTLSPRGGMPVVVRERD